MFIKTLFTYSELKDSSDIAHSYLMNIQSTIKLFYEQRFCGSSTPYSKSLTFEIYPLYLTPVSTSWFLCLQKVDVIICPCSVPASPPVAS